jgi:hypothetical protein
MMVEYHGVKVGDSAAGPIALFRHAEAAQQWKQQHYGESGTVAPVSLHLADGESGGAPDSSDEDRLRAEIRAELIADRTRERIRREVEAELDAEEQAADAGDLAEEHEPATATTAGGPLADDAPIEATGVLNEAQRQALVAEGFVTVGDVRRADDALLDAVGGIGQGTIEKLREATKA